jgi:twitching motility two-component system response regulator PilG
LGIGSMQLQTHKPIVLAVDDSKVTQETIKAFIGRDYNVLIANNAEEALSLMYKHPIAILLLDVSMPDIDGFSLCRTLRMLPEFRNLPIVMLTGRDRVFDKVQGRLAGATEYLTKPFDGKKLKEACKKLLA